MELDRYAGVKDDTEDEIKEIEEDHDLCPHILAQYHTQLTAISTASLDNQKTRQPDNQYIRKSDKSENQTTGEFKNWTNQTTRQPGNQSNRPIVNQDIHLSAACAYQPVRNKTIRITSPWKFWVSTF